MTGMMDTITKLLAAGLICGGLLTLAAGAQREILRFGCSCLLVIFLMSFLRMGVLSQPSRKTYHGNVQQQIDDAAQETRQKLLEQICADLKAEIERQAKSRDIVCSARVTCTADEQGIVTVEQVQVDYHSGPREELAELRLWIAGQLSVSEGDILIQEVEIS